MYRATYLLSMVMLGGCAAVPVDDLQRPIRPPVPKAAQITGSATIDCYHPSHPQANSSNHCQKGIPVRIEMRTGLDGKAICVAVLGYQKLVVHTKQQRTLVVWEIDGPQGYGFAEKDTNGKPISGVWLKRQLNSSDPTKPDAIYDRSELDDPKSRRRYKVEVMPGAPPKKEFDHGANVVGPNGPCEPWDPIIVNQDN